VTADEARGSLWSDLVNGLLDARSDPATARFDAELASAVAAGELSRRTAQRLRFWQRAAVNAADDHARTVVPAVLGALETARSDARAYVEQGVATLDAADAGDTDLPRADRPPTPAPPEPAPGAPGQPPTAAQQAEPLQATEPRIEDLRRASTAGGERPSTLEGPTPRLFVADLRDVPATDRT
jgi:hypothetical protein